MLDLPYEEDVRADTDMNVVMTGAGRFVEVQGTAEQSPSIATNSTRCSISPRRVSHGSTTRNASCSRRRRRPARLSDVRPRDGESRTRPTRCARSSTPLDLDLLARPADVADVDETGDTLEGNALLKARALSRRDGPRRRSPTTRGCSSTRSRAARRPQRALRRRDASYEENVRKLLSRTSRRRARASHGALSHRHRRGRIPTGPVVGRRCARAARFSTAPRGERGFGYDSDLRTDGDAAHRWRELTREREERPSHRGARCARSPKLAS